MNDHNDVDKTVQNAPSESAASNGSELEQLRRRVRELEQANAEVQSDLAKARRERDQYLADVYALLRREFLRDGTPTEAELRRMINEEPGLPLEAFIDDLERIAKGR